MSGAKVGEKIGAVHGRNYTIRTRACELSMTSGVSMHAMTRNAVQLIRYLPCTFDRASPPARDAHVSPAQWQARPSAFSRQ